MKGQVFSKENRVAIISGSSQGIGLAIAREFGMHGIRVVINGREFSRLYRTCHKLQEEGIEVFPVQADIRDPKQCARLINECITHFGRLDIVVNNAAVSSRGSVQDMADSVFKIVVETNYIGSAYLSKYAIPHLRKTLGSLLFINSVGGFRGMPYNSAYTASKMAQSALAQALQIELRDSGIHVGIAFVGFTKNDPKKKILDVDGTWIYLPKRNNVRLADPTTVARTIYRQIQNRQFHLTMTALGHFTEIVSRYFPWLAKWILILNRNKIKDQFTLIGGERVTVPPDEEIVDSASGQHQLAPEVG